MSENNKLQKKLPDSLKEKTQYVLAFGVIATMLLVTGFPSFVIAFFGIFAYFVWKTFLSPSTNGVRDVFEFYLTANEILRDDDRRWFGFEIQEVITSGELILQRMSGAPPLVYFTLGALYHRIGNYKAAVNHLTYILENSASDEAQYVYATPELKEYVKVLRKIEREPTEAPQTSAAIRALERTRRNRGQVILEESKKALEVLEQKKLATNLKKEIGNGVENGLIAHLANERQDSAHEQNHHHETEKTEPKYSFSGFATMVNEKVDDLTQNNNPKPKKKEPKPPQNRKTISEVLHDIYDK
ncbi:MAG TPA: hypothetical protein PKY82_01825 [Pyrinomonadaceae bacterium]|nr:hypothetical protein [Pyrinomonadaceae bacterium]